jgi:hypothetical protein
MKHYLVFTLVIGFLLVSTNTCFACDCSFEQDPIRALNEAGAVFSGRVVQVGEDVKWNALKGEVYEWRNAARISVEQSWKGISQTEVIVMTSSGGCGFEFNVGESYIVYAYKDDRTGDTEWHTSLCSKTSQLSSAADTVQKLGEGKKPIEHVQLSSEMTKYKVNKAIFMIRGMVKSFFIYFVICAGFVLLTTMYMFRKRKK